LPFAISVSAHDRTILATFWAILLTLSPALIEAMASNAQHRTHSIEPRAFNHGSILTLS